MSGSTRVLDDQIDDYSLNFISTFLEGSKFKFFGWINIDADGQNQPNLFVVFNFIWH